MSVRPFNDSATLLSGTPVYLGVIVATTTKNNHDTVAPFNNTGSGLGGKTLLVQASAALNFRPVTTNAGTVTTANGIALAAGEKMVICMGETYGWLAAVGSASLSVWELI
jgi:hypothetical protein